MARLPMQPWSCPSLAAVWGWWLPPILSVTAAERENFHCLEQKTDAVSMKFVMGDIPGRAEPHAMQVDCRGGFFCLLMRCGQVFRAGDRTKGTWFLILALPEACGEVWDLSWTQQAFSFLSSIYTAACGHQPSLQTSQPLPWPWW